MSDFAQAANDCYSLETIRNMELRMLKVIDCFSKQKAEFSSRFVCIGTQMATYSANDEYMGAMVYESMGFVH